MAEAGEPETGKAIEVAKGKGGGNLLVQAMTVPFLDKQHPNLIKIVFSWRTKKKRQRSLRNQGLQWQRKGVTPAQFSLFCRVSFMMFMMGQQLLEALDCSPGEITVFQFYESYKGMRRKQEIKSNLMEILDNDLSKRVFISRCAKHSTAMSRRMKDISQPRTMQGS